MKILAATACLLVLASPAVAQEDLYWMVSLNDGGEMQMSAFGVSADLAPGEFHDGAIPTEDGEVYFLIEASTGAFLDTPEGSGDGAAVAAMAADAVAAAAEQGPAEKHRAFQVAAIWAMDVNTETTVHWNLTGVEAYGHESPEGHYLVRLAYDSAAPPD